MSRRTVIAVDLDGTLAHYDKWPGEGIIGLPIPPMVDNVKRWLRLGYIVIIFTARATDDFEIRAIQEWLMDQDLPPLMVTREKLKIFDEIWDDRAIGVERNTGKITTGGVIALDATRNHQVPNV